MDDALAPERFACYAAGNLLDEIERKSCGHVQGNRLRMWQNIRFEYDAPRSSTPGKKEAKK